MTDRSVSKVRRTYAALAAVIALVVVTPGAAGGQTAPKAQLISEDQLSAVYAQGVARIKGGWVLTGTFRIARVNEKFKELKVNIVPIPLSLRKQGYVHVGDIDVVGKIIYAPFEEPNYNLGHQVTARFNLKTLKFIDSVELPQHENSFVTIDPKTMTAYSMDRFGGAALIRYDIKHHWKPLPPLAMDKTLDSVQGADINGGYVWLQTSNPTNEMYRVNIKTGHVDDLGSSGHPGGEGEGIDATPLKGARYHSMTADKDVAPMWFGHFKVVG
jgi:hypothetical protein